MGTADKTRRVRMEVWRQGRESGPAGWSEKGKRAGGEGARQRPPFLLPDDTGGRAPVKGSQAAPKTRALDRHPPSGRDPEIRKGGLRAGVPPGEFDRCERKKNKNIA